MRSVTTTTHLYQFDELNESAQKRAISRLAYVNVDDLDWWEFIYEDANNIGIKITEFDIYRREIDGELTDCVGFTCKKVLENHGKECDTYKTMQEFYRRRNNGDPMDGSEFTKLLLEDYLSRLTADYEYLTSAEAIISTIKDNEYEFDADGNFV